MEFNKIENLEISNEILNKVCFMGYYHDPITNEELSVKIEIPRAYLKMELVEAKEKVVGNMVYHEMPEFLLKIKPLMIISKDILDSKDYCYIANGIKQ